MQTLKDKINSAHGVAARQSGWTEKRLVNHLKKKGADDSDIKSAVSAFRKKG